MSEPKYKIVDETAGAPAVAQVDEKTSDTAMPDRGSSICPDGFGEPSPRSLRLLDAYGRRDGVDSYLQAVEWICGLRQTGQSNVDRERLYEKYRQSEIAFWKEFMTPTDKISVEWIAKAVQEMWTFPVKCGRQWSDATLRTAMQEIGIEIGGSL